MATIGLDDTLHAVVQVTHEHGLPLHGVSVHAGRVQVFTDLAGLRWWAGWLTDAATTECRYVVWELDTGGLAFHVNGTREGIDWTVCEHVPVGVAVPILAAHDLTVSTELLFLPADVAVALADALGDAVAASDQGDRRATVVSGQTTRRLA